MKQRRPKTAKHAAIPLCGSLLTLLILTPAVYSQDYSEWNQATGIKHVEYRWRAAEATTCEIEYRNRDDRDHRKYKSRIVFRRETDEQIHPYTVVSFAEPAPHLDHVPECSQVTDVSVSRF